MEHRQEFEALHTQIIVIVQAKPAVLRPFLDRHPYPVPFYSDPEREGYRRFELKRNSLISFLRPWEVWGYLKILARGYGVRLPYEGEDPQQLGGNFLLNQQGEVLYSARPDGATDRPSSEVMLAEIRRLQVES